MLDQHDITHLSSFSFDDELVVVDDDFICFDEVDVDDELDEDVAIRPIAAILLISAMEPRISVRSRFSAWDFNSEDDTDCDDDVTKRVEDDLVCDVLVDCWELLFDTWKMMKIE